ncbi:response regulator transcription factor [Pseudomonas vancouverensis]|uniref:Response regulator transcription factor n=1 Tax=Pseudomonas vancouverensis TaxID=95300 RepID=A0A1H2N363_PSEVA|nr:response regulator transcription factor [Pseudomonas vancouverensis]KAB0495809.1 response regulator transcription factor [Pseudomonas vancouverensis]TDB65611.1 response regulator transcription factor [Pseudomonas vancouverensis]SDU99822.1 two component transcriptional regulator, LuxR family [Pseudomonas vancouverensis]
MSKVLIVDDHPVIRMAVAMLMKQLGHEVIAETDNGVEAVQVARDLLPDLVILDIGIPRLDGLEVIKRLKALELPMRILVLTSQSVSQFAVRCLAAGALGFVTKGETLDELEYAVKAVLAGYQHVPRELHNSVQAYNADITEDSQIGTLSNREVAVLRLLGKGMSNKEIADDLLLSNKTISTYKSRLMEKLDAHTTLDLIEFAKRNHLE